MRSSIPSTGSQTRFAELLVRTRSSKYGRTRAQEAPSHKPEQLGEEMENEKNDQPRVREKQFVYNTSVHWWGEKTGILATDGREALKVSSPPEFKGAPGLWTPEDMFVGALEMCQLLTFLALAKRRNISILSYASTASGNLELVNGGFRFTKVVITPLIGVADPAAEDEVLALVSQAHHHCLISNSVSCVVEVNPAVIIEEPERVPTPA